MENNATETVTKATPETEAKAAAESTTAEKTSTEDKAENKGGERDKQPEGKYYTQEELDKLIERRVNRAKKQAEKQHEEAKSETDSEEVRKLQDKIAKQNQRIIKAEARDICRKLSVDADMIDATIALTNFADVDVDENGDYDVDDIKEALESTLKKYPKFIKAKEPEKKESEAANGAFKTGVAKTEGQTKSSSQMTTREKWKAFMDSK